MKLTLVLRRLLLFLVHCNGHQIVIIPLFVCMNNRYVIAGISALISRGSFSLSSLSASTASFSSVLSALPSASSFSAVSFTL
jgi:hypothetical protein